MNSTPLKMSFQPRKSGKDNVCLMAIIYANDSTTVETIETTTALRIPFDKIGKTKLIKFPTKKEEIKKYKPVTISTGITLPAIGWDNNKKQGRKGYEWVNERLMLFRQYTNEINAAADLKSVEFKAAIKKFITDQFKENIKKQKYNAFVKDEKIKKFDLKIDVPNHFVTPDKGYSTELSAYVKQKTKQFQTEGSYISGITDQSFKSYERFVSIYKRFKDDTKTTFDLKNITTADAKKFISWMIQKGKDEKDKNGNEINTPFSLNYVNEIKKTLKNFITKAKKDGIISPAYFDIENENFWKIKWEREDDPYLTFDQLEKLRSLKFDDDEKNLEIVRDAFLLGCNCGASISDLKNIKHLQFNGKDKYFVEYTREKTNKKLKVPIRQQYIIDMYKKKYKSEFNFNLNDVVFNRLIKIVCLRAGFTTKVTKATLNVRTGQQEITHTKLWELISSKCMRKTFASNEVREYLTPLSVVKIWTGHSSEAMLMIYIMLDDTEIYELSRKVETLLEKLKRV